jgi:hypothetical protein
MALEIKFTPKREDYIQASRLLAAKTPLFIVLAVLTILVVAGSLVGLALQLFTDPVWNNVALVSLVIGVFYLVYYFFLIPAQLSRTIKKNEALQKDRKFIFGETEVDLMIGNQSSRMPWEHFTHVMAGKKLYVMVYEEAKKVYPFLPKSAFADLAEEETFLDMLKEHNIPLK